MNDTINSDLPLNEQRHFDLTINVEGENTYIVIGFDKLLDRTLEVQNAQIQIENRPENQQGDVLIHLGNYYIPASRIIWIRES